MGTRFTISRKTFYFMMNGSSIGMGVAFIYYAFFIDLIPKYQEIVDIIFYISLVVFLLSGILKLFKRVL